ncbi:MULTISPECIES: protein-L-isoaspartate(D-aspartate) O-methyltransferase [Ramlibacter]|uniref:Protein-L-isoaspartate O-methyltransferase n=1 Tax=Ramlibacter pinisoli TaxID=2682844 RepID=A0A6N8IP65_9BURK|nr:MULTISPECIES: protein-L-isoaspartate(D-aspartate) O-methyltransferase [Ramlibacter]MBA2963378.1 protein-L-isoaspartate(D-aspartate) O-methyltransferase [Ramlibacter sp. CGMCC 1.13660]MVQ28345.1 protein-L-isoaspartate(D-aspartate) O-methyltransferase [Ramlibacter pinisoli]
MTRRPGFPARLDLTPAVAPAAGRARPVPATRPVVAPQGVGLDSGAVRARMVTRLAAGGLADSRVLAAMGAVDRHRFVDSALANQAYEDTSLPIGLGQTISKPSVVARMAELLLAGTPSGRLGRVLEVGTGCGFQAAVLAHLAKEVYSIERLRGLHDKARENLRPLRLANVHLLFGDGMQGFAKGAPYAGIIAAAGGDAVPDAWIEQLAVGGRIVAPTLMPDGRQALVVLEKGARELRRTILETVLFVPLKSGIA